MRGLTVTPELFLDELGEVSVGIASRRCSPVGEEGAECDSDDLSGGGDGLLLAVVGTGG